VEARHIVIEAGEIAEAETPRASLIRYSPALVLLIVAIIDIQRWADPDLWGHVAFGSAMLAHYRIGMRDTYSYSAHWHLWLNHEWLSELLMGATYKACGIIGLKLMKFACSAAVCLSLMLGLAETDAPMTTQLAGLLWVSVIIAPQMQFRPQMFTFALTSALMALLARYTYRGSAPIWLAVPMLAAWANLHGGFIAGVVALGLFSIVSIAQDQMEDHRGRPSWWLPAIFGACVLATLATPYGIGTWRAVAHALANPATRDVIEDWQPLLTALVSIWHRNPGAAIPSVLGLAMFVAFATSLVMARRRDDLALVAVAIVMIVAAFISMRNLPLAAIACVIPLTQHGSYVFRLSEIPPRLGWMRQTLLAVVASLLLIESGLFSPTMRAGSPKPVGAIAFMQEAGLSGNILNEFSWGEYLIWHMTPTSKVFIDGRYDTVYPSAVIDDYLSFISGGPRAHEMLRKHAHEFILVRSEDTAALAVLGSEAGWIRLYRDATCVLFVRSDAKASSMTPVDVTADETPASDFP